MATNSNVIEILNFLRQLGINNNREWFKAHKERYDALRKPWEADVARLIELMATWDEKARGLDVKQSVYRIYRDTRFSPDKTPYKTYFSAVIARGGRHCVSSGYYLHIEPGQSMLCGGIWWPEKDKLNAIRRLIDAEADEFAKLVAAPELTSRYAFEDSPFSHSLKRVPREFNPDHPLAKYLKMKSYILVKHLDDDYFDCDDWVARVNADFRPLKPVHDFLDYVYDE